MNELTRIEQIKAHNLASQITNDYDYINFKDAWQEAKEYHYTFQVFIVAYDESKKI